MKVFFIGNVIFSKVAFETLLNIKKVNIIGLATKRISNFNSDHIDLSSLAKKNKIPFKYVKNINSERNYQWINELSPDLIFCIGWSSLIKKSIINIPKYGVIGYHPSKLPFNRGRHPIIWSLVLGLNETASTVFKIDEGVDSGDIISQKLVKISISDDAESLYNKLINKLKTQIKDIMNKSLYKKIELKKQSNISNYWRKRNKNDGKISFNSNSSFIHNLIRALSKPYPGAHLIFQDKEIKIFKSKLGPTQQKNIEPGKVLKINKNYILIKTADKSIWISNKEFDILPKINDYIL